MTNNSTPITDAALAELDRLHAETGTSCDKWLKACIATFNAYPALRQRLTDAEERLADAERERNLWKAAGIEQAREMLSMAESGEEADEMMRSAARKLRASS